MAPSDGCLGRRLSAREQGLPVSLQGGGPTRPASKMSALLVALVDATGDLLCWRTSVVTGMRRYRRMCVDNTNLTNCQLLLRKL